MGRGFIQRRKERAMSESEETKNKGMTRREAIKAGAMALGGLAIGGAATEAGKTENCGRSTNNNEGCSTADLQYPTQIPSERYRFAEETLDGWDPLNANNYHMYKPPEPGEMRIIFLGSMVPPARRAQQEMSIFVEVGPGGGTDSEATDHFVFDCGCGVSSNYAAMGIPYGIMNKVFLTHLHADHMSDLTHIYCFGAAADRKSPLYVFGPSRSGVPNPKAPPEFYEDGTTDMCKAFRKAWRWHSESMSFIQTKDPNYAAPTRKSWGLPHDPVPVDNDSPQDGYGLVPIELDWTKYGKKEGDNVAYDNKATGVKITHFPVIHCRRGSIGFKVEWNGLSMIYTGDTKPEIRSIEQASGGKPVDVFIHECGLPPDVWAFKNMCLKNPPLPPDQGGNQTVWDTWQDTTEQMHVVQDSSHTPPGALAYILNQISPRPRLTVASHFPTADDTTHCAAEIIRKYCPWVTYDPLQKTGNNLIFSFDLMVLRVWAGTPKPEIGVFRGKVNDFGFGPVATSPQGLRPAKYHNNDDTKSEDPCQQLLLDTWIPPGDGTTCNYRDDGY
jgi:ribonuclease Z